MKFDVINKSFEKLVEEVTESTKGMTVSEKNIVIDALCEQYVLQWGKAPDSWQLQLLANIILDDDLSNPDKYKSKKEEHPFHSDAQRKRRKRKEFSTMSETLEHISFKKKAKLSTAPPKEVKL